MSKIALLLPRLLVVLGLSVLVSACQLSGGTAAGPDDVTPNAVTGDAIEVTALDSPPPAAAPPAGAEAAGTEAAQAQTAPTPAPADPAPANPAPQATDPAPQPDLAVQVPEPPKSEQQLACERKKGRWSPTGKGSLRVCVFNTRDAGKQCTRESQCEGVCLARSGTCSPVRPLLGCHEILQDNGARVTLCIE
ncbi:hypothetical protein [Tabrizicola aquatica]|uniref:hypothetical protein n=1 Tax=Tabrizicola aquatica TaxID=909926 RepID=UPI0011AF8118|nr:hypothetical protein [Tabrizicola aquatica]